MAVTQENTTTQILARTFQSDEGDMPVDAAKAVLRLCFRESDLRRMHELAQENQKRTLSASEEQELADYRSAAYLVDILRARARLSLKKAGLADSGT